jgi:hypothetical protein
MAPKIVDGVYRSRYNFVLDREHNNPNVIGVVKNNRWRFIGHKISGAEDLPQTTLFSTLPKGRRNQEIQVSGWREK